MTIGDRSILLNQNLSSQHLLLRLRLRLHPRLHQSVRLLPTRLMRTKLRLPSAGPIEFAILHPLEASLRLLLLTLHAEIELLRLSAVLPRPRPSPQSPTTMKEYLCQGIWTLIETPSTF